MTAAIARPLLFLAFLPLLACGSDPAPPGRVEDPPNDSLPPPPPACMTAPAPVSTAPTTTAAWALKVIDNATYPLAVCNDGTPAVFGIRRNPASNKWLVFLKGGGKCEDGPSCAQRYKSSRRLMSSTGLIEAFANGQDDFPTGGIFATDAATNPAWHNANLVEIAYCTSDTWQGDASAVADAAIDDPQHWHFRGHEVVKATLATLTAEYGFGAAIDVTLGGGSAGGAGVYANADDVAGLVPSVARYVAMADAGFRIDYPAFDPVTGRESTADPTGVELFLAAAHQTWGGRGDASCDAAAADDAERSLCRSGVILSQRAQITAPLFVINSQLDHNPLQDLGIDDLDHLTADQSAYVNRFGAAMRTSLALVDPHYSVFADYSTEHVSLGTTLTTTAVIDGTVMMEALVAWYLDPCVNSSRIDAAGAPLPFEP